MEAFSLLKYWRTTGGGASSTVAISTATKATIVNTASAVSPYSSDGEDGPYFDLEFALRDQESDTDEMPTAKSSVEKDENVPETETEDESESGSDEEEEISVHENDEEEDEEEGELKFAFESNECTDKNATLSPSDELFFKGDLVSIEPSSILLNGSEENSKIPVFFMKSAIKFRVLLLKLQKKSKSSNGENTIKAEKSENDEASAQISATPKIEEKEINHGKLSGKFFAVKFKVDEAPIVSLFTRDTSSKVNHNRGLKPNVVEDTEERKLTKEVVQKYLKMVKPFYIRVSKRYVGKLKFSGNSSFPGGGSKGCVAAPPPPSEKGGEVSAEAAPKIVKNHQKQGNNLQAGLNVVRKHLGKSRSASAAEVAPPPKPTSNRRDDSLLQLQDGIQGAILHCKRSFNASRDVESSSILSRSVSDPSYSYEKSVMKPKASSPAPSSSSVSGEAKETKGIAI